MSSILRALKTARERRYWNPPKGATHVLAWVPPWIAKSTERPDGYWVLAALPGFLADYLARSVWCLDGRQDIPERDLTAAVMKATGGTSRAVALARMPPKPGCGGQIEERWSYWVTVTR